MTPASSSPGPKQPERLPHAALDRTTRIPKARKIINILGQERFRSAGKVLEIGCGSGVIASILADEGGPGMEMHAVDVVDTRVEKDGYEFKLVGGTALPYEDGRFDIVISNHVIEHVGDAADQRHHLEEIRRVLAADGVAYLAVPNRWRIVEPHFKLPLLSWFPHPASDGYVKLMRRGTHYDCNPPSHERARALFESAGLHARDMTITAVRETLSIESGQLSARAFDRLIPGVLPRMLMPLMPTYVFLLDKQASP